VGYLVATNNGGESKGLWQKTKDLFGQAMRSFGVFDNFVPSRESFESGASQLLGGPCFQIDCSRHDSSVQQTADVFQGAAQAVAETGNTYYPNLAKIAVLTAASELAAAATPTIVVIGRVKDLQNLAAGERSLLDLLPNLGSPQANWSQNAGVLRSVMNRGMPIRDASPGDIKGQFLNAERNLLESRGWKFDTKTNFWNPPK